MNIRQLSGRHLRLRRELAIAYSSLPWNAGYIDRLANELSSAERELALQRRGQSPERRRGHDSQPSRAAQATRLG
jgi:hypothetical protein